MKFEVRNRDRKALIGLAAAAVLYFLLSQIALPAFDRLKVSSDSAAQKEEQLRKYRRALIRKGRYATLLEQARKNMSDAEARLIRGDNPSLASVEFQTIVEQAAAKTGIGLNQRNIAPARKKDAFFNEITMTLAFDCTPNQLTGFLSELRSSPKFTSVRSISVAPTQVVQEPPKKGEFQKVVRVSLALTAILSSAPSVPASPGTPGSPAGKG